MRIQKRVIVKSTTHSCGRTVGYRATAVVDVNNFNRIVTATEQWTSDHEKIILQVSRAVGPR